MIDLVIRKARLVDMPILLKYEQEVIDYERAFNEDIEKEDAKYYNLHSLISGKDSAVFVGEIDGKIIATGYALIKEGLPQFVYDEYTYLGFMYVAPEYRGKGINAKIIQAALKWSEKRGIKHVRLQVYSENNSAIKAYEKLGFKTELQDMKLTINSNKS
ncbi:MAG TPA: GNAT family N-acetyltransferase [Flavobacteriaceae bacterium]|nr:GNAT family N-acetyltransferase [Flavobacteriaceae bacterium]